MHTAVPDTHTKIPPYVLVHEFAIYIPGIRYHCNIYVVLGFPPPSDDVCRLVHIYIKSHPGSFCFRGFLLSGKLLVINVEDHDAHCRMAR